MDFKELAQKVAAEQIGSAKLTDVKPGVYGITIEDVIVPNKPTVTRVFLVSEKKNKYPISVRSLAAMRIVTDAAAAQKVVETADARNNDTFATLQDAVKAEKVAISEATKFTCVHRLRITDSANDRPVYKNNKYTGYGEYVKNTSKISSMPGATDADAAVKNAAYTDATLQLHSTALKAGVALTDDNLLLMPVFTVS